ncbi:ATP-dependent nuclease [Syntrophus gentianae]|uniref:ATP-dependent nuclease n=1 Tax=Syntrophus gentianae TaxID=43775 RepID=UPI003B280CBF
MADSGPKKKPDTVQRPHVLLLDEPELCLHPGTVRKACDLLYSLPNTTGNWQVMVTTHSPCFVDFSREHTSIVRVERQPNGKVVGTTIFRPNQANFDDNDREQLKLLNLCDPYVAEFFFGGKTIVVEGDTEYAAFKYIIGQTPQEYDDVHIVRARGKATIVSLCKILNQFGAPYAVLHDSDKPTYVSKDKEFHNPAWAHNKSIQLESFKGSAAKRLVASIPNFEAAYLSKEAVTNKPYNALNCLKTDADAVKIIRDLLGALIDFTKPLPHGAIDWNDIDKLRCEVEKI